MTVLRTRQSVFRAIKLTVLLVAEIIFSVAPVLSPMLASAQTATPPKFVQEADKESKGKTVSQSFASATKAGNLLVAYVVWDNTSTATVSDTKGDVFVGAGSPATVFASNKYSAQVFYAKNIAGGAGTVTATFGTATKSFGILYIHEYSGVDQVNPLDASVTAKGSSSSANSGALTTTSANELLFGGVASSGAVQTAGTGYTVRSNAQGNMTEDSIAAAAGSYSLTATQSGSWAMQLVAFKGAVADATPPTVPTNLVANADSSSQVDLSWQASTDDTAVAGYSIYRNGVQIATTAGVTYTDTGLSAGTAYAYAVSAYDASGNVSAQSASVGVTTLSPDTTPPTTPGSLTAVAASMSQINLSWDASTDDVGVTGYIVYRNGVQVATPTTTSYVDTGLAASTPYTYAVSAVDAAGNSSTQSDPATATTQTPAPDTTAPTAPTNLAATTPAPTQVNLTWNVATDNVAVSGYQVVRDGAVIATTSQPSFADTTVTASSSYSYEVVAFDAAGNTSPASDPVTVTTPATTGGGQTDRACPAFPAHPNTSCTGIPAGTTITNTVNGDYTVTTANEDITGWHVTGILTIAAAGVTIENSQIDGGVRNNDIANSSFAITDSTVGTNTCSLDANQPNSIWGHNFTATRVYMHGHGDAVDADGSGDLKIKIIDSLLQPCFLPGSIVGGDGYHTDGVQDLCPSACYNITLEHNTIDARAYYNNQAMGNSALNLDSTADGSHLGQVSLDRNLFMGGTYSTSLRWSSGPAWIVTDNAWVNGAWTYAPIDAEGTCTNQTWSGNTLVSIDSDYNVVTTIAPQACVQ